MKASLNEDIETPPTDRAPTVDPAPVREIAATDAESLLPAQAPGDALPATVVVRMTKAALQRQASRKSA